MGPIRANMLNDLFPVLITVNSGIHQTTVSGKKTTYTAQSQEAYVFMPGGRKPI